MSFSGGLSWLEWQRVGDDMSVTTAFYSDQDMADPGTYYGGFKEGRITKWGTAERALSDPWTGEWQGSTFSFSVSDYDRTIRPQLVSATDRYWSLPVSIRMTTRTNRAASGIPSTVFVGPIVDAQPARPLAWDITLADSISQGILSDRMQVPWRMIRDGFLSTLDEIADSLDVDTPEPIIYGEHRRVPGVDPASPQGFIYKPTYLGIETVSAAQWHVWLVAGHAVANILDVYIDDGRNPISSITADEGTKWLIPHFAGWTGVFTTPYVDKTSDTYDVSRRYTLIYGKVGQTNPDNCAAESGWKGPAGGSAPAASYRLLVALQGVEPIGDGTGAVISDRLQQYKHFAINFLAHQGQDSYQSGAWLTNPVWALYDGDVSIVDEDSFDDCSTIGIARLPADGYVGAAIIGAKAGDQASARKWIAEWNRSCGTRFGWGCSGMMRVVMLHPTAAIKAAAQLFTDGYDILEGSFETSVKWDQQANVIPFKADYEHASGQWQTFDVATWDTSIALYGRAITSAAREYPFAPGITMSYHLARLEAIIRQDPPRVVTMSGNVDEGGLGSLDLGDYIRYRHYAAIGTASQIRLGQVQRIGIRVGSRQAFVEVLDCEDLIDYDLPVA